MKLALSLLITTPILLASMSSFAGDKDFYKSQQRANESNRQSNNAIVNNNSQRNYNNKR
jgi:hypothetical protein